MVLANPSCTAVLQSAMLQASHENKQCWVAKLGRPSLACILCVTEGMPNKFRNLLMCCQF